MYIQVAQSTSRQKYDLLVTTAPSLWMGKFPQVFWRQSPYGVCALNFRALQLSDKSLLLAERRHLWV